MKTKHYLILCTSILSLYLTSCKVIYRPLRYETNLQDKEAYENESLFGWPGSDWTVANQIRETPAIDNYFAPPNEPFEISVIADYLVQELDGISRLLVNPIPLSPNEKLYLSKLTLNKNNSLLVEITDFGSSFNEMDTFIHELPHLAAPSTPGNTDHYEFIGYWKDARDKTLAQGIWIDVTADESARGATPTRQPEEDEPYILRVRGGASLATLGGKYEYEISDDAKTGFKPGFLLGASVPYQISPMISVEAGLQVETKGYIEKFSYDDDYEPGQGNTFSFAAAAQLAASDFRDETTFTYLGIPVTVNVSPFPQIPGFGFMGGIQPSYLLGRKSKSSVFGSSTTDKSTEGFKALDMGVLLGAGYQFENGLGFRMAYEHGLTDITEHEFNTFRNRSVKLMATYDIPFHFFNHK